MMGQPGLALYAQIASSLRQQIEAGEFAPESRLPSQRSLAEQFETTLVTVRQALRLLQDEGLIRVAHGVGTFVAPPRFDYDLLHLTSFTAETRRRGDVTTVILRRERGVQHADAAAALGLDARTPLARLSRLRRAGDIPIIYQRSYLPPDLGDLALTLDAADSLYQSVQEAVGGAVCVAREILQPVQLSQAQAEVLHCPPGALAFRSSRTTFDGEERPLVYDEAFLPDSRVRVVTRRTANRWSLEYQTTEAVDGKRELRA